MINWKIRFKNKAFWLGLVPLVLLLVQQVAAIAGVSLDFGVLQDQLVAVIGTVFALLALLGIVVDPTTEGIADSERAMEYEVPYPKHAAGETDEA